jgi:DNA-directed RNA polymerase alpha subunit
MNLSDTMKNKLIDADIDSVNEIINMGEKGLVGIPGIGPKSAQKILELIEETTSQNENSEDNAEDI